jgi:DNA-binding CsgD family transcriptional regulator/tetratricopeptide (TPR) repeat protein
MTEPLLERDATLATLDALLASVAATGDGRVALITGEAGAGKTALVERFITRNPSVSALWGACDALFTPRSLGPLYDIAPRLGERLRAALERQIERGAIFSAFLDDLQRRAAPIIAVFEDVHWADEATLDLIKYLGRRLRQVSTLLILTYRDDENSARRPLASVLGDLPARAITRLRVLPLSAEAVATLTLAAYGSTDEANRLYAVTGGNPFFVTEALANGESGVPDTVRDAVLTRSGRLSPTAHVALDLVAVAPGRLERVVTEVCGVQPEALDECVAAGMLRLERDAFAFRHELSRLAIEGALPASRRRALNAQVAQALLDAPSGQVDPARIVHHASRAGDSTLVARYAPIAARQAATQGAHREAAAHYRSALDVAGALETETHAALLEGLAYECYLTSQMQEAARAREAALVIWRQLEKTRKVGHTLRWLSRLNWYMGRNAKAERCADQAVALLSDGPEDSELAMAYSNRAQLSMLANDLENTVLWSERAIAIAERIGDAETLCHALNNLGTARLGAQDLSGEAALLRSLDIANRRGFDEHVARALTNLACMAVTAYEHVSAARYISADIEFCRERDLDSWELYIRAWRAQERLNLGDWPGAEEDATAVMRRENLPDATRIPALIALGCLRARRGDPGVAAALDEAADLARATGELQRVAPALTVSAEAAWLRSDLVVCAANARVGFDLARAHDSPWRVGALVSWLWRAGEVVDTQLDMSRIAEPFAAQIAGDWRAAAAAWERLGSPYEQALALLDGDEVALRAALLIFEGLGAAPALEITRQRLREVGARGVPRGPRAATRANPKGLTNRQMDILLLLAQGMRNAEIAERLSMASRTVDHHVSAVLSKLGVRSRAEAIATAHALGLTHTSPG